MTSLQRGIVTAAAVVFLVLLVAGLGACSSSAGEKSSLACDHYRNVLSDFRQGILTVDELRGKLKEVHDDASIATTAVQGASTNLLASVTSGNASQFGSALDEMSAACKGVP